MTIHDQVRVGGVSESCKYNCHEECRAPTCQCDCHKPAIVKADVSVIPQSPEKACPKCGSKRPFAETFCRIDGERLASLLCGVCGSGMNVEDAFCYNCGSPKGKVASLDKPSNGETVTVSEVDYGSQILRGLQEELGNVDTQIQQTVVPQRVVEQPAGTQGSFKFVNRPSPNRIRGPVPAQGPQPSTPVRRIPRLPTKP